MIISKKKLKAFVRGLIDECNVSRRDRVNQNTAMTNYALCGGEDTQRAAMFNKTYAYLDDLQSLLYSPVSLRFHIGDLDTPNILEEAKGRAAASKLRSYERKSDTDTRISDAMWWALVKGKTFIKSGYKRNTYHTSLVQPDSFGVRHENHGALDEDMEAFCQTMLISFEQFARMVWNRNDRRDLMTKASQQIVRGDISPNDTDRQIVTGGLYPFQPAGSQTPNNARGVVDWMGAPQPTLDPKVQAGLLELSELWVWDDEREDWATFQMIGDDLLLNELQLRNEFAYDISSGQSNPHLKGHHPFNEFCINPIDGYFWGRSEVLNVALLQEAINSRISGINRMLRKQEEPSYKIKGVAGVNQNALTRFSKPGGYWSDVNPTAEIQTETPQIPPDLWNSIHEYERMFDEMGGLPPTARGHGDSGVRSHAHAETLVRMFSPRFKDRALLGERAVEALGGLHLDMAKAHVAKKLTAWVPKGQDGMQGVDASPMDPPPAKDFMKVMFQFADLDEDSSLTIDAHSSSPAFSAEAKALVFDLFKIGALSKADVLERSDVTDPEELMAGVTRREIAAAEAAKEAEAIKMMAHSGSKKK
jgi:hypothetical protein